MVKVRGVRLLVRRLVLSDGIDEGVTGAGVLHEQPADA